MQARIEIARKKILVGQHLTMSFTSNKTFQLWSGFMPKRKEIKNQVGTDLFSLEVFPEDYFKDFDPTNTFEKWAAVEVSNAEQISNDMQILVIPKSLYAVFIHKGLASEAEKTYHAIFSVWLPTALYEVDDRPHFAIMGAKYRKDHPDSEEEIWIPIKPKCE